MFLRVWFGLTLVSTLLWLYLGTFLIHTFGSLLGYSRKANETFCVQYGGLSLQIFLALNPYIKVQTVDGKPLPWDKCVPKSMDDRAPFLLMNHTSFLDFFIFTASCPSAILSRLNMRTMIKAKLFDLPLYGAAVGDRCGSFAVHFKRDDAGSFQVDAEKQAAVMERVTKHVEASGTIAVCPEGQIAKDPPAMQPFRRGSFAIPIQFEMPIWGMVMHGCYDGWPKNESIGGFPATITVSLEYLMTPKAGDDKATVAQQCQDKMQAMMDTITEKVDKKGQ